MADGMGGAPSLKGRVSEDEWRTRVELAALYRLVALHGWDDMIDRIDCTQAAQKNLLRRPTYCANIDDIQHSAKQKL